MLENVSKEEQPVVIPPSLKEATKQHRHIGTRVRRIATLNARLGKRVAVLRKKTGEQVDMLKNEALALAKGIYFFATEHRVELLLGGGKTVKLPHGGTIEWQLTEPSLCYDLKEEDAVALLKKAGLGSCIDYSPTVNKTKVKEKIKQRPALLKKLKGFSLEGGEVFRLTFSGLKQRVQGDAEEGVLEIVTPRDTKAAQPADT